jgi:hypothetical protein
LDDLLSDEEEFQGILNIYKRVVNRNIDSSLSQFEVERAQQTGNLE